MEVVKYNGTNGISVKFGIVQNSMDKLLKQLEHYRLENKITQETLAKDLGVAFSTISRWLNGKVKPNKIQTYHIEKFLKGKVENKK